MKTFQRSSPSRNLDFAESCIFRQAMLPPKVYDPPKVLVHVDCPGLVHQQKTEKHLQLMLIWARSINDNRTKFKLNQDYGIHDIQYSRFWWIHSIAFITFITDLVLSFDSAKGQPKAKVLFIPTSYPGPLGQLDPRKTSSSLQSHLNVAGVAVAQPGGPLVILTTPAVCKLWRLIGMT